jgi:hypothetical protein
VCNRLSVLIVALSTRLSLLLQRVTAWTVECMVKGGITWQPFTSGSAIGHKRIAIADSSFSGQVVKLRLNVTDGVELPASVSMATFAKAPCM